MGRQNSADRFRIFLKKMLSLKRINLLWRAATAILLMLSIFYCLIAFTPIRTTIPGYPDAHSKKVAVANALKIDSLENAMLRWNIYAENLSRVLAGERTIDLDSVVRKASIEYISDKSAEELARQDSLLRETVHAEEQFGVGSDQRALPVEGIPFFTPVKGAVAAGFDTSLHPGIDISAAEGSIVSATLDGNVIYSSQGAAGTQTVILQCSNDISVIYMNCGSSLVNAGAAVKAGTPIAMTGSEQLHFELRLKGSPLDPTKFISF